MNTKVIGLTGRKRCGKGTAAAALFPEYVTVTFARPIKDMLRALGITDAEMEDKETVLPRFGKSPRFLMQTLGTEWGREMVDQSIWLNVARNRAEQLLNNGIGVVFDDVRFDNEARLVRDLGGEVWRICRASLKHDDAHVSEQGVDFQLINRVVLNDFSISEFNNHIRTLAHLPRREL